MEINDTTYDIDNVDIEQEMESMDVENEIAENEAAFEQMEAEEAEEKWKKMSNKINAKNLDAELLKVEPDRKQFSIKYKGDKYNVVVLAKLNNNDYVFTAKANKGTEWKTMKMSLLDIQ